MKELMMINKNGIYQCSIDEATKKISEIIISSTLRIGYDIHLGFNFPDNRILKELLSGIIGSVIIEPIGIDERKQSGDHPFSPIQVHVEVDGRVVRKQVASSKSTFLSQLPCDRKKIIDCYKELSFEEEIKSLINGFEISTEESLGEFILKIHCEILEKQLGGLSNVSILQPRYDRYNCATNNVHGPDAHLDHDILYIPLHKEQYTRIAEKFEEARTAGKLIEKPYLIILPQELPRTYFRKGGE